MVPNGRRNSFKVVVHDLEKSAYILNKWWYHLFIYDDHINNTGHSISIEDFCILDKVGNKLDLLIHES